MNILIDGVVFQNKYQLGIQRYFNEVLPRISERQQVTIWNEIPAANNLPGNCSKLGPDLRRNPRRWHVAARAKRALLKHIRSLQKPAFNLFCSTYYTRAPYRHLPEVAVVYDMVHEQFLWSIEEAEHWIARKRAIILNARICIAISQSTADDLKSFYPEVATRVRVVHPGCEHLLATIEMAKTTHVVIPNSSFVLFARAQDGATKTFGQF